MTKHLIDLDSITMGELCDAADLMPDGIVMGVNATGPQTTVAMIAVIMRRTQPGFTYEQARALRKSDLDILTGEEDGAGEAGAASNGGAPQLSPVAGS